jgi:hypothetical protein
MVANGVKAAHPPLRAAADNPVK